MKTYAIETKYAGDPAHVLSKIVTRHRSDAAEYLFRRTIIDAIASNAWLDTQAGTDACNRAATVSCEFANGNASGGSVQVGAFHISIQQS